MFVYDGRIAIQAWRLGQRGIPASEISLRLGVPRSTVRGWLRGELPRSALVGKDQAPDPGSLPSTYPYLLGLYLGDGYVSSHPRGVYRLRVSLDLKYPGIVGECKDAIQQLLPGNQVGQITRRGRYSPAPVPTIVDVSCYSKAWPRLLPQHGPGRKHERQIALTQWQRQAVRANPRGLLRGLIHSDGCRFMNKGANWSHPRYCFTNSSEDILGIFEWGCQLVGVHSTRAPRTVYVSRKADVATLDEFIGPKS